MSAAQPLSTTTVTLAMDFGQFTLTSGMPDSDELALLEDALATPPSAGDGQTVLVTSPHQNNFAMAIAIERWAKRPQIDPDGWDQVSVETIALTASTVRLESPTMTGTTFELAEGSYWVEISGRGFVNYGWPGSTTPGDTWRLRFWPNTGPTDHTRKLWNMPGFGISTPSLPKNWAAITAAANDPTTYPPTPATAQPLDTPPTGGQ